MCCCLSLSCGAHTSCRSIPIHACLRLQARKRGLAQQLLLRDPNKTGPMIGKDRLSALRATEAARNGGTQLPVREQAQSTAASPSSSPSVPLITKRAENV